MKTRIISAFLGAIALLLCLQSASGGRAANNEMDRTNAPGSGGNCGVYCHNSTGLHPNTQFEVVVKDIHGTVTTTYLPGQVYILEFAVTTDGNPFGYGMQAVILDSLNMNTGDMLAVSTNQTQLTTISNGREFVEHQGISSTGVFRATWMAPPVGTGPVTLYGIGLAVNGSGTVVGDDLAESTPLVLSEGIPSSTTHLQENENEHRIFPNPNQGTFYIETIQIDESCSIKVLNLAGQIVYQEFIQPAQKTTHQVNLKENIAGIYWVEIEQGRTKRSYPIRVY